MSGERVWSLRPVSRKEAAEIWWEPGDVVNVRTTRGMAYTAVVTWVYRSRNALLVNRVDPKTGEIGRGRRINETSVVGYYGSLWRMGRVPVEELAPGLLRFGPSSDPRADAEPVDTSRLAPVA
jgi:hypothetical protein